MSIKSSKITAIVGAQWGDEGKGKITDFFAGESDYVVRFQGGNNAGHTVIVKGETYKLHLIPSGIIYGTPISIIGNGVVVDPEALLDEIKYIKNKGINPRLISGVPNFARVLAMRRSQESASSVPPPRAKP